MSTYTENCEHITRKYTKLYILFQQNIKHFFIQHQNLTKHTTFANNLSGLKIAKVIFARRDKSVEINRNGIQD